MIRKKIFSTGIILCSILALTGCGTGTQKQTGEIEINTDNRDIAAQALEHAHQMQQAAIKAQDENAVLRAKIDDLTRQLEALQVGLDANKKKLTEPINPGDWEQRYNQLQAVNDELRKLVQYERGLREDLLKKIEKDQITINELKSRLEELEKE